MARGEREHRTTFDRILAQRRVRPTALSPLWNLAGFGLGVATALMGEKAAMACTVAVEETIEEHYAGQAARLGDDEAELRTTIEKFRADEIGHKEEALAAGAEQAPAYEALTSVIKAGPGSRSGCRREFAPFRPSETLSAAGPRRAATPIAPSLIQLAVPIQEVAPALVQVAGREGAAILLQLVVVGSTGERCRCIPLSRSSRLPLSRLHGLQAVTTLAQAVRPPRDFGTT